MKSRAHKFLKFLPSAALFLLVLTFPIHNAHAGFFTDAIGDAISIFITPIALLTLKVMSLLNMLTGVLLNFVIQKTVVEMSTNTANLTVINQTWTLVRDIANMGFIFILLYAAIQTILGVGKDTKQIIIKIVLAAILMNFSLFITKLIIDAANILTLVFYNFVAPGAANSTGLSAGLSNSLMQPMGLQSIWSFSKLSLDFSEIATIGIFGSIMTLVASFVFISISAMFVIRYISLIFVLILSPIAVLAHILPSLKKTADQWWETLIGQAMFAPAFMFMAYITVRLLEGFMSQGKVADLIIGTATVGADGSLTTHFTPNSIGVLFNFVVVIGLLIGSLIMAKKVAGGSHKLVNQATGWATGKANDAFFGTAIGGSLRQTAGRVGNKFASDPSLIEKATKKDSSAVDRLKLYASRKAASATFDARNATIPTGVVGDLAGGTLGRTGLGKKLGFNDPNHFLKKSIGIGALAAGQTDAGKGGTTGQKENSEAKDKRVKDVAKAQAEDLRKAQNKTIIDRGKNALVGSQEHREMLRKLKDMSEKEIITQKPDFLAKPDVAQNLTTRQLEAIEKSEMSEGDKERIKAAHFSELQTTVEQIATANGVATDAQKKVITSLSDKQVEMAPSKLFEVNSTDNPTRAQALAFVQNLTPSQTEALRKSGKLSRPEFAEVTTAQAQPLDEAFTTANYAAARDTLSKMSPEILSKQDQTRLEHPEIAEIYTPSLLNQLAGIAGFGQAKRTAIRDSITNAAAASATISNALNLLQAVPSPNRIQRQAILSALTPREKKIVLAAMWLESETGEQLF